MFVVSGCDSEGEGGHLNGQPNALNDHHHHQYQSRANLRQEVRHNDRDGVSLGRVSDVMLAHLTRSGRAAQLVLPSFMIMLKLNKKYVLVLIF